MTEFEQYMSGFSLLSKEEWKTVRSRITVQELSKGTLLEKSGKVCHHYYFIQKGAVRTFSYLDTKEITIRFSFENELTTSFISFITRFPAVVSLELLEDSIIHSMSKTNLEILYQEIPKLESLAKNIFQYFIKKNHEENELLRFLPAKERLEHLLKYQPKIFDRVPHLYIASYLGITPETLSRIRVK
ncbi:MAG: Crp/Fnr family transcriptional regulator [Sphingobacteriales bacterium]|nr:Crp/Fnr family transcriptional regulator [Sphingobacteriales bacterium]